MAFTDHQSRSTSSRDAQGTTVGESILITGNISGDESLTVLGRVDGAIRLSHTLEVADSGIVKADVVVQDAIISGIVVGNVTATGCVHITETGRLVGDIQAPRVIIVAGARVRGQVDMAQAEGDNRSEEEAQASLAQQSRMRLPSRRSVAAPLHRASPSGSQAPSHSPSPGRSHELVPARERSAESSSQRRDAQSPRSGMAASPTRLSVARDEPRNEAPALPSHDDEALRYFGRPHLQERAHSVLTDLHPRYTQSAPAAVPLRPMSPQAHITQTERSQHTGQRGAEPQLSAQDARRDVHGDSHSASDSDAESPEDAQAKQAAEQKSQARVQQVHAHSKKRHGRRRDG